MVRLLIYFLAPVPLALLGLLGYGMLAGGRAPSIEGLGGFLGFGLVGGYLSMGLQSAVFAVLMLWLERRGVARAGRCIVAAAVGGLFGATIAFADDELFSSLTSRFTVLGAAVGPVAVLLADLLAAPTPGSKSSCARRRAGSGWGSRDGKPDSTQKPASRDPSDREG